LPSEQSAVELHQVLGVLGVDLKVRDTTHFSQLGIRIAAVNSTLLLGCLNRCRASFPTSSKLATALAPLLVALLKSAPHARGATPVARWHKMKELHDCQN
jgi:hypothetical protein